MLPRSLVVATLLLLALPAAAAQNPPSRAVTLNALPAEGLGPEGFLAPEAELAKIPIVAKVGCSTSEAAVESLTATFEAKEHPTFASAVLSPLSKNFEIDATRCVDSAYRTEVRIELFVAVTRDAPALRSVPVKVTLRIQENGHTGPGATYGPVELIVNVTVDYLPLIQVQPQAYFQKIGQGAHFDFPVLVRNVGNGLTRIEFELTPLGKNRLANLTAPGAVELGSRAQDSGADFERRVVVNGTAPGGELYVNGIYSFQLTTKARSPDPRGTATDETSVTLSVQVQGGAGAPGVALAPFLLALAFAAMWRRR